MNADTRDKGRAKPEELTFANADAAFSPLQKNFIRVLAAHIERASEMLGADGTYAIEQMLSWLKHASADAKPLCTVLDALRRDVDAGARLSTRIRAHLELYAPKGEGSFRRAMADHAGENHDMRVANEYAEPITPSVRHLLGQVRETLTIARVVMERSLSIGQDRYVANGGLPPTEARALDDLRLCLKRCDKAAKAVDRHRERMMKQDEAS